MKVTQWIDVPVVNDVFVSKTSYTSLVLSHVTPVYVFIARSEVTLSLELRRNSAISNSEKRRQMKASKSEGKEYGGNGCMVSGSLMKTNEMKWYFAYHFVFL